MTACCVLLDKASATEEDDGVKGRTAGDGRALEDALVVALHNKEDILPPVLLLLGLF